MLRRMLGVLTVLAAAAASLLVLGPPALAGTPGRLLAGQTLALGHSIASPSGSFVLTVYPGEVSLTERAPIKNGTDFTSVDTWDLRESAPNGDHSRLTMTTGGDLVFYSGAGKVLWHAGTHGAGNFLGVLDTGDLGVFSPTTGHSLWHLGTGRALLGSGQDLAAGSALISRQPGMVGELVMQPNGDLVLFANGRAIWDTKTYYPGSVLVMQNGDLILYRPKPARAVWSSHTRGNTNSWMLLNGCSVSVVYNEAILGATWSLITPHPSC